MAQSTTAHMRLRWSRSCFVVAYADDSHGVQHPPKFETTQSPSREHVAADVRSAGAVGVCGGGLRIATHAAFWHSAWYASIDSVGLHSCGSRFEHSTSEQRRFSVSTSDFRSANGGSPHGEQHERKFVIAQSPFVLQVVGVGVA